MKATTKLKQTIDTTTIKFGTKFKAETIVSFNFSCDSRQNITNPGNITEIERASAAIIDDGEINVDGADDRSIFGNSF